MGLLDIAKRAYNYIVGADNAQVAAQPQKTNNKTQHKTSTGTSKQAEITVIATEIKEAPVDKVEIKQGTQKKKSKIKTFIQEKKVIDKKILDIRKKCKANGISFENVLMQLGIDFAIKKTADQMTILQNVEIALNEYIANKKFGNDVDIDKDKAVAARTQTNIDAQEAGVEVQQLSTKKAGNVNKELSSDYEHMSEEEKIEKLNEVVEQKVQEEEQKYDMKIRSAKSKSERTRLLNGKEDHIKYYRRKMFMDYSEVHSAEESAAAVSVLKAEDMAYGTKYVLHVRCNNKEERTEIADNKMTVDYLMGILKAYHDRGEVAPKEVVELTNKILVQAKSYMGVQQYEDAFYKLRLYSEENGLPEYLTEEQLTAMSTGIGLGISFNENMTVDEKANCLNIWDEHASEFHDYAQVKENYNQSVKQYLQEHPEAKQGIEELYRKYKEEYGKVPDVPRAAKKRLDVNNCNSNTNNVSEIGTKQNELSFNTIAEAEFTPLQTELKASSAVCVERTPKDIAHEIKDGNITVLDAINKFHEKAFEAIFEDHDLFIKNRPIAKIYINNNRKDLQKLLKLSNFSSAVELIAQNISPIIKEEYASQIKMSAITRDAIFGKDEDNAAA